MSTYIHYGSKEFVPEMFRPITNRPVWVKPQGGLWASRIDSKYGWKDWCDNENFRNESLSINFKFKFVEGANVIFINSLAILNSLPQVHILASNFLYKAPGVAYLDFEAMQQSGIDAIELSISDFPEAYMLLYGWDCDSVLVMNKDAIVILEE